jgi:hypothetical protein
VPLAGTKKDVLGFGFDPEVLVVKGLIKKPADEVIPLRPINVFGSWVAFVEPPLGVTHCVLKSVPSTLAST